jgi:hypothetical protein
VAVVNNHTSFCRGFIVEQSQRSENIALQCSMLSVFRRLRDNVSPVPAA